MSPITIIWSMIASACLTLAGIYLLVWCRNRTAWASLLFSLTAVATAAFAFCELWMMRAETPGEFATAVKWAHVPMWLWVVSLVGFVRLYLRAGRSWLMWAVCGLRTFSLLLNFLVGQNLNYREITHLRHVPFLGESVTVAEGLRNPWMLVGQLSGVVFLLCLAKIKSACEINNIQRHRVTCYMDENRLVRSFGEGQVSPRSVRVPKNLFARLPAS